MLISKVILPVRPQPDTIVAIWLLKRFGIKKFPGIDKAQISIDPNAGQKGTHEEHLEKGELLIDVGGKGGYDHHAASVPSTASFLIAKDLNMEKDPSLSKLLKYTDRDDKFGLGTISKDPLDKAFGLSGIIGAFNKQYPDNPEKVLEAVLPFLDAHFNEENKRINELPKIYDALVAGGKVLEKNIKIDGLDLKIILIESDDIGLPGYLRAQAGGKYDIVIQKRSSGHVNVLSRPRKNGKIPLEKLVAVIRATEFYMKTGKEIGKNFKEISVPARINEVTNWYYDPATNSIQNGGVNTESTDPTEISWSQFPRLVDIAFS